jgi:hypothetical protein
VRRLPSGGSKRRTPAPTCAYSLLRAVLGQTGTEGLVATSPCQIPGAGRSTRQRRIEPANLPELAASVEGMPERLRLLVLLGGRNEAVTPIGCTEKF